ncbi:MAG: DUF481 domain-containing protein, partial [Pseudomonadota bacterium]
MTLGAGALQADVLHMKDGSRVEGTLEEMSDAQVVVADTFAGELTFSREALASLETRAPVTVRLDDGTYLTGALLDAGSGNVEIALEDAGSRVVELADVAGLYREDPQTIQRRRLGIKVSAEANVGVTVTDGNTETENLHLDGRVVTRSPRNRYTVTAEYNREESEDVLVQRDWRGLVKYDHFVSEKWFWFNSASFESDEFADLELRSALAAGMGYQFFESDARSLSLEIGPSYIDENFETAEDESFVGSRWALDFEQQLWNGLFFFHYQEGLLGLEETSDLTIRSRTGLRMSLTERIIARIQTAVDWDNSPPAGTDKTQLEHAFTIGYQ